MTDLPDPSPVNISFMPELGSEEIRAIALCGTLGSGKTTLLNSLLRTNFAQLKQWIVIENDVGQSNIDATQLAAPAGSIRALTSGCVCCDDKESLRAELLKIKIERAAATLDVNTVAIETTGIANPSEVKEILSELRINHKMIVTVNVRDFSDNKSLGLLKGHLKTADMIVLTHWDHLIEAPQDREINTEDILVLDEVSPILETISAEAGKAPLVCMNRVGDLALIQQPSLIEAPVRFNLAPNRVNLVASAGRCCEQHEHKGSHHHDHDSTPAKKHAHPVVYAKSLRLREDGNLTPEVLMEAIKSQNENVILRVKGYVAGQLIQGVRSSFSITPASEDNRSILNVISLKPLPENFLEKFIVRDAFETSTKTDIPVALAERETERLLKHFPRPPVSPRGRLLVDFMGDKAYDYVEMPGVSRKLRGEYYKQSALTRIEAIKLYNNNGYQFHESGTYWGQRLGSMSTWLITSRESELAEAELLEQLREMKPATLFFTSMINAKSNAEYPVLSSGWLDILPNYASLLRKELGETTATELLNKFKTRMTGENGPDTWKRNKEKIEVL